MVLFSSMPVPGTVAFDPNRLLMVWVIATTLPSASAVVTCVVWAEPAATPRAVAPYSPARSGRICARRVAAYSFEMQALDRDVHEGRIAGARVAVREADLEHLGDQVEVVRGAEAQAARIEAFEDVQHLDQVEPARGRRRSARDLEAAVAAADGLPLDRLRSAPGRPG